MTVDDHKDECSVDAPGSSTQSASMSIVIPTRNRLRLLFRQVAAVRSQVTDIGWELIVVDNGSTDGTQDALTALGVEDSRIRLIVAAEQFDAAYARNVGAAAASADRLAFIDDDDVVGEGWLVAIFRALDDHPLVAPRIDYELLNSPKVTDGWPLTQASSLLTLHDCEVSTGHVGITRELWGRLGGQRTGMLVGEDMDLTLRSARDLGIPPRFTPSAIYHRQLPTTLRGCFRQGRRDGRGRVQWMMMSEAGRPRAVAQGLWHALKAFWWLLSRAPLAALGKRRHLWMMTFGERIGHLEQTLRTSVARG